jgi:adenylate cyclase
MKSGKMGNYINLQYVLIIIAVFFVSLFISILPPAEILNYSIRDLYMQIRGPQDVSESPIIIVEMSNETDYEIPEKYPWPVDVYARLIHNLNRAGVKAIGIDVMFDQRDMYDLRNDSLFAAAVAEHGNVILISSLSNEASITRGGYGTENIRRVMPNAVLREASPNPFGLVDMMTDRDGTIRSYLIGSRYGGEIHHSLGMEVLRVYSEDESFKIEDSSTHYTYGPYQILKNRQNRVLINYYGGPRTFSYIDFYQVIDDENYDTTTELEAFEVNNFDDPDYGLLDQGVFKDKIVLVGATMPELQDFHGVPIRDGFTGDRMAGVEVHAHALQTILDGNHLVESGRLFTLGVLILFIVIMLWLTRKLSPLGGLLAMTGMILIWLWGGYQLFIKMNLIVFTVLPMMGILLSYISTTVHQYLLEEKEKRRIKSMFSSYVSPELVDQMVSSDDAFQLGGEEKNLTVFFSDIQNFSTLSEKVTPTVLISLMNEYLDGMSDIIINVGGTLDKYIGDAIMAFFGAPVAQQNHAERACHAAVKMQKSIADLRQKWANEDAGLPIEVVGIQNRIGINSGEMVVGNMGSSKRFNYTVLGDNVNVAARCEAACKELGVYTMVTETTKRLAEESTDVFCFRPLGVLRVKGRNEPVIINELVGYKEDLNKERELALEIFEQGLELYNERKWIDAEEMFRKSLQLENMESSTDDVLTDGDTKKISAKKLIGKAGKLISRVRAKGADSAAILETLKWIQTDDELAADLYHPAAVYIRRCEVFLKNPPEDSWDGVFDQVKK